MTVELLEHRKRMNRVDDVADALAMPKYHVINASLMINI